MNVGLEAAAQTLAELHYASKEDPILLEEAPPLDPSTCNPQFEQVWRVACVCVRERYIYTHTHIYI